LTPFDGDQEPVLAVNVCPCTALPLTVGGEVFWGVVGFAPDELPAVARRAISGKRNNVAVRRRSEELPRGSLEIAPISRRIDKAGDPP
jgi:hypothetical protein